MEFINRLLPENAKYLAERTWGKYTFKLYQSQNTFYEAIYVYGSDVIREVHLLENESILDLYIESMHRIGVPVPCNQDQYDNLNETGRMIAKILERDHQDFYYKLLWDEMLHWFCDVIEVRAAYHVDNIHGMKVTEARDIAVQQLLKENPEQLVKPPYIQTGEGGTIKFPLWFYDRKSMAYLLIDDEYAYGNGIHEVLGWLYGYGGWENATKCEYWEEQTRIIENLKKKKGIK
jgi:hypothetical protein